jgi:hypothetical protein
MVRINVSAFSSAGLLAIAGCAIEAAGVEVSVETAGVTVAAMTISANNDIADEHCRVHTKRQWHWPAGRQLLIYRGATLRGACTVDGGGAIAVDTIEMSRAMMKNRVWLSADGMDPNNGGQIAASISGVTVRNEAPSSPAAPRITAAVTTLAGLEVEGGSQMQ